jgi:hypothetical protein
VKNLCVHKFNLLLFFKPYSKSKQENYTDNYNNNRKKIMIIQKIPLIVLSPSQKEKVPLFSCTSVVACSNHVDYNSRKEQLLLQSSVCTGRSCKERVTGCCTWLLEKGPIATVAPVLLLLLYGDRLLWAGEQKEWMLFCV